MGALMRRDWKRALATLLLTLAVTSQASIAIADTGPSASPSPSPSTSASPDVSPSPSPTPSADPSASPSPSPTPSPSDTASVSPSPSPSASPTIIADQADYHPGSTVVLTGAGWVADETVHIFVNDDIGSTWSYSTDVASSHNGTFSQSFVLPSTFVAQYR